MEFLHERNHGEEIEFTVVRDLTQVLKIKVTPEQSMDTEYF